MPELSQGKQFLYRLIVSQLQQDGFVNVATSLSIATIGQTKVIPSDRLSNLISLCAQVVRDTDAEATEKEETPSLTNGPGQISVAAPPKEHSEMGSQHSAFYPALSQIIDSQNATMEQEGEKTESEKNSQMSQAAIKSLQQLQMLKVFSNMTEATRQAYLQSQALQKKPFYLTPPVSSNSFPKESSFSKDPTVPCYSNPSQPPKPDPIRPFPLSTPDIKTPRCRSTLLPFSTSAGSLSQQDLTSSAAPAVPSSIHSSSSLPSFPFNGASQEQEVKVESARNIHAMEEIIKLTEEQGVVTTSTITTSAPTTSIPLQSLFQDQTDSAIQELIMQRQLKQRRFKDLDCSFVNQLIQPAAAGTPPVVEHKPKIDFSAMLSRLSGEEKRPTSPPSLPLSTASGLVDGILAGTSSGTDQARFECPRCARVFAYEYVLQTHMRQVCPDRSNYKHPCTVCKKRFQNQSSLKRHMIVHTGERKYECEVCHKRFGRSHHLKRHVKIHEMEAANYSQHHQTEGIPEETLQLILQLGAMNKFPLSPASLIDNAIAEDIMSNNDCDSLDDGESQGDVDMEDHSSDLGESVQDDDRHPLFSSALAIQNIINNNAASLFYSSHSEKKPLVAGAPPPPGVGGALQAAADDAPPLKPQVINTTAAAALINSPTNLPIINSTSGAPIQVTTTLKSIPSATVQVSPELPASSDLAIRESD